MADVFMNYAAKDRGLAQQIRDALKNDQLSVWLDQDALKPGQDFSSAIQDAINDSQSMLTLWTPNSIHSDFVRLEADLAFKQKKLIPLAVGVDSNELPAAFSGTQTIFCPSANINAPQLRRIVDGVQGFLKSRPAPAPSVRPLMQAGVQVPQPVYALVDETVAQKKAFISYASEDEQTAIDLVEYLEGAGCPCWISFRDVDPGEDYRTSIVNAMSVIRFLVLLYSQFVNRSSDVWTELLLARRANKRRFCLKTDSSEPSGAVLYELVSVQWIECIKDKQSGFQRIAQRAKLL